MSLEAAMSWVCFFAYAAVSLIVLAVGCKRVTLQIVESTGDSFGSLLGRMLLSLAFWLSPFVVLPQLFGYYASASIHTIAAVWFAVFSVACIGAVAAYVGRLREAYQALIKRSLRRGMLKAAWRFVPSFALCLLILAICTPLASGVIKNALREQGVLEYEFAQWPTDAFASLRVYRNARVWASISSCEQLRDELLAKRLEGPSVEGSRLQFTSGKLTADPDIPTGPDDPGLPKLLFELNDGPSCTVFVADDLALRLAAGRSVEIDTLIAATGGAITRLQEIAERAPLGAAAGALFGYVELLETLQVSEDQIKPVGRLSIVVDWLIWALLWTVALLWFVVESWLGRTSRGGPR